KEEPPQDFDIRQLIREECSVKVCEEQKQNMKDTIALNSKLILINSNSKRLDKKEQEVKNVVEQPSERGNHIAPILSTKEPEYSSSMGYEYLSITPETESDKVTESNAKNLLPIPSECEVTLEDKRDCDVPVSTIDVCDDHYDIFSDSKINDDISIYDDDFKDTEYVEASLSDFEIVSMEEENGVEEDNDNSKLFAIIQKRREVVTLLMLITLFPNMICFALRLSPIRRGDIRFLEELLIEDSILSHESSDSNFEDNPSILRPPSEPPDAETDAGEEIPVEQGDKAENKDKGKSPVVTITRFKDLNEEFAECINNNSNEVNAVGSLVSAVELNFTNSTNDFSTAGPSNAAMPNLEDLSHNADDVGAEADTNNMESIISVNPISTTRIHKDHPTSQIIGDLSSTTQTKSMARGVRDQGRISQMFNEDFHTCMFACFLS
nr:hypothetical protein [Tanacetum cinerariifolium]